MRFRFEGLIYSGLLLCFFAMTAYGQPYKRLTAADFRGVPQTNSIQVAYTHCSITYTYDARPAHGYYMLRFHVKLLMDRDLSWMDRKRISSPEMMAEILKHEQGHYNIAYLEQQELLRTVSHTVFHADYQREAQYIFDRISSKYKQLNAEYDDDTQHSANRAEQRKWDARLAKALGHMGITATSS